MSRRQSAAWVAIAASLGACSDYGLFGRHDGARPQQVDPEETDPAEEPDSDAGSGGDSDATSDSGCDPDDEPGVIGDCDGVVADPWSVAVERFLPSPRQGPETTPLVGTLDCLPTLVWSDGAGLHVADTDGTPRWDDGRGAAGPAIGDIDGDGHAELLAMLPEPDEGFRVVAWTGAGDERWLSAPAVSRTGDLRQVVLGDLDGDGTIEVIADGVVLEGATGEERFAAGPVSDTIEYTSPVTADLYGDGAAELIVGDAVYDGAGTLLWSAPAAGRGATVAVTDTDGDGSREVWFLASNTFTVTDPAGNVLWTVPTEGDGVFMGQPCAGDFDGDGLPEVVGAVGDRIVAADSTGILWEAPADDREGIAGCSGADLDGDGALEVLYADHSSFRILDGRTGDMLFEEPRIGSATLLQFPVPVDLDRDGALEIVVGADGANANLPWNGLVVFGHAGSGWAPGEQEWPTQDYVPPGGDFRSLPACDSD